MKSCMLCVKQMTESGSRGSCLLPPEDHLAVQATCKLDVQAVLYWALHRCSMPRRKHKSKRAIRKDREADERRVARRRSSSSSASCCFGRSSPTLDDDDSREQRQDGSEDGSTKCKHARPRPHLPTCRWCQQECVISLWQPVRRLHPCCAAGDVCPS